MACHQADYDEEHAGSSIPDTCLACHNVETWEDADFDHALSGFPLLPPHDRLECDDCHGARRSELKFPAPAGSLHPGGGMVRSGRPSKAR